MAPLFLLSSNNMSIKHLVTFGSLITVLSLSGVAVAEEPRMPYVRIAELEIDPTQLESFKASVKEEMDVSVRVEPGVLAIYAVGEKDNL
jgi:hypothetical protein